MECGATRPAGMAGGGASASGGGGNTATGDGQTAAEFAARR